MTTHYERKTMFKTIDEKLDILAARRSVVLMDLATYGVKTNTKNRKERKLVFGVMSALYLELDQINRATSRLQLKKLRRGMYRFVF